jgi:hypothetical protein
MNVYKLFPSKYVIARDLNGRPVTLAMRTVQLERMGQSNEEKPVLYFEKASKGMVLNRTNAMTIASLYGPETEAWTSKRITLYPTKIRAFGEIQDVIRIKEEIPPQPVLKPEPAPVEESVLEDAEDVLDEPQFAE